MFGTWFYDNMIFLGVEKDCYSSSIFTALSNLAVTLGLDNGLVLFKLYGQYLLFPVVTCSVGFTKHNDTKQIVLGDG